MAVKPRPRQRPRKPAGGFAAWYAKVAAFNVESLFSKSQEVGPPRTVCVGQPLPDDYFDAKRHIKKEYRYKTNQVRTSKYTIITFIPRNILEQFRRVANCFFLFIAILQFFPLFSTISPGLVILPLLIILAITAVKDGYEDIKRHQSDSRINYSRVRVLHGGGWENPNAMESKDESIARLSNFCGCFGRRWLKRKKTSNGGNALDMELAERGARKVQKELPDKGDGVLHGVEFDDEHRTTPVDRRASHTSFQHFGHDLSKLKWKHIHWEDVRVGDFVKITNEEPLPADILICATSEEENVCYVETKNLDGETNLKSRNAVPVLTNLGSAEACAQAHFRIELGRPDSNMYKLNGAVEIETGKHPVEAQSVLLRGTVLKNTKWAIGVVLFTGEDTKIVLNAGGTPSKRSRVERQMNPQVFVNLIILAIMSIVCGIADSILEKRDFPEGAPWLVGDNRSNDNPKINGLITAISALITFQNVVPISLYISIEFVRTIQAAFIYFDREIYYQKTDSPTLARSWNLSDDLGQIEYIFSDKTGTLTQNEMIFRNCTIGEKVYKGEELSTEKELIAPSKSSGVTSTPSDEKSKKTPSERTDSEDIQVSIGVKRHFYNAQLMQDLVDAMDAVEGSEGAAHARTLNGFFTVLALCHTVLALVDPDTGRVEYRAQSPDEAALVQAAADAGFIFNGRDRETLKLKTPFSEEIEEYELMNVLDFTSARKRMSVIVRKMNDEDNRIFLMTKGADNVIFERLKPGVNDELRDITGRHLDEFASEGLRTLTLAYRVVSESFYEEWSERYAQASVSLEDREEKIAAVYEEIETDLRLLGVTAIEDRLQDGVPETIADLKLAGIKIWVLTGDKLETAIAIGYSTNLIGTDSNLIVVRGGEKDTLSVFDQLYAAAEEFFPNFNIIEEEGLNRVEQYIEVESGMAPLRRVNTGVSSIVGSNNGERPGGFVLVIEGHALAQAFADEETQRLLLRLSILCEAIICCRVSPLQKALVVKMVKEGVGAMTLAIGDGANDVSMIQAADIGVGVSGEEGLQAVNSSDYAIAQFRFLKRLLLVHGHWSYYRNGTMIVNFFYKNLICIGVLWWFQIYCAWSSQYVFEYTYILFWNVFWSLCPVIAIGIFDRIIDDRILMALPELYVYGRKQYWFGIKTFALYMLDAVAQSAVIFFLINYSYFMPTTRPDGYGVYTYEYSTTMAICAVMCVNLFNGLNTAAWTAWVFFAVFIGIILVWAYTAIYSIISPGWFYVPVLGNDHFLFHSAIFWLCIPLVLIIALTPRYLAKAYKMNFAPTDIDKMRLLHKLCPDRLTREELLGEITYPKPSLKFSGSRPSLTERRGSRADMATGVRDVHRGFDFAQEEGGVAIQRIQTNLSERRKRKLSERLCSLGGKDKERKRPNVNAARRLFSIGRQKHQQSGKQD